MAYQVKVGQGRVVLGHAAAGKVDERRIDGQRGDHGRRVGTVDRNAVACGGISKKTWLSECALCVYVLTPTQTLLEMDHALLCPAARTHDQVKVKQLNGSGGLEERLSTYACKTTKQTVTKAPGQL